MNGKPVYDLSIVGTVGLPASYGGFETLAEQLAQRLTRQISVQVFCSGKRFPGTCKRPQHASGADLCYVEWEANGWQSIPYDFISLWRAASQTKTILVLGVSGCLLLPIVRLLWPCTRIVTNLDGLEWKRQKWGPLARAVLRISEWAAVRFSHAIVADNQGIHDYITNTYRCQSHLIAYGGDQAETNTSSTAPGISEIFPSDTQFADGKYYFGVCRIEPENNIADILAAFGNNSEANLVLVGNWDASCYARRLRRRYINAPNIELKASIYDQTRLRQLRRSAKAYIHGHSAGGTNPSLVEAMYAGMPVIAYDIDYNRHTTHNKALYWRDASELVGHLRNATTHVLSQVAADMAEIGHRDYTWSVVTQQYADVLFPKH